MPHEWLHSKLEIRFRNLVKVLATRQFVPEAIRWSSRQCLSAVHWHRTWFAQQTMQVSRPTCIGRATDSLKEVVSTPYPWHAFGVTSCVTICYTALAYGASEQIEVPYARTGVRSVQVYAPLRTFGATRPPDAGRNLKVSGS